MKNAYGYSRVSGKSQIDGDGHPRQIQAIESFARSNGYAVLHIYQEDAIPGKTEADGRPKFQEMLAALTPDCSIVIVENLDRLARSYAVQENLLRLLVTKGVTLISANTGEDVTDAFMGDPMRRALVQIQGIFAELDKNLTVAKLWKARERKRITIGAAGGNKPYGYMSGGRNNADIPDPAEHPTLCLILDMKQRGYNAEWIAERLNNIAAKSRDGKPWRASVIRKILSRTPVADSCTAA